MTNRPQLDLTPELRAIVHAARVEVAYQPATAAQPDPATERHWNAPIDRAVTVVFHAALPDDATVAAAAADLLYMRGCDADGTPPPPASPHSMP